MAGEVRFVVQGLPELKAACKGMAVETTAEIRAELIALAGPIYDDIHSRAEQYGEEVASQIRVKARGAFGVSVESTARKSLDVAMRRPNLAQELEEEFDQAADAHANEVYAGIEAVVARNGAKWF